VIALSLHGLFASELSFQHVEMSFTIDGFVSDPKLNKLERSE